MENKFKAAYADHDDFDMSMGTATVIVGFDGYDDLFITAKVVWDPDEIEYHFDDDGDPDGYDINTECDVEDMMFTDYYGYEISEEEIKSEYGFTDEDINELKKAAIEEAESWAYGELEERADDYWPDYSEVEEDNRRDWEAREADTWWDERE